VTAPYRIRPAETGDVPEIVAMVHELAAYERSAGECHLTEEALARALFAEHPAVFAHVALTGGTSEGGTPDGGTPDGGTPDGGTAAGFALWFLNYSTWTGNHGIYLEDLFVRPEHRGAGLGRELLAELARICVTRGYDRFQWWVLDWNPATEFYRRLGAQPMDQWTVYRLAGRPLAALASGGDSAGGAARPTTTLS
jgi:GNAT superfamily N-acetyltransferase